MKTILVPTDFSYTALNAANYAADMASAINADLLLLYVYQLPVSYSEVGIPVNEGDFMADADKSINELKKQLFRRTGGKLKIDAEVRMAVSFRRELENVCEDVKPYGVIMGSQGSTKAEYVLFGSHALYAMRHLMWPLIAVPPETTFSSIKKICLACDYKSVLLTTPLDEIKLLVHDFNAKLYVINTGKKPEQGLDFDFESGLLKKMLNSLKPDYHFITSEYTDEAIINFTEKNDIDLLIVIPKRHDLLEKLIRKSHTKQMVLHCHVPVMALHQ